MKLGKITKNLQPTLVMAAGAIAGNYAQKMIPLGNEKLKSGAVLIGGLLLAGGKGMMGNLGSGIAIAGALNLAKSFGIGGGDFINGIEDARFINGFESLYAGETLNGMSEYNYNDSYQ